MGALPNFKLPFPPRICTPVLLLSETLGGNSRALNGVEFSYINFINRDFIHSSRGALGIAVELEIVSTNV